MNHIDEDRLLEFALEIIDGDTEGRAAIAAHLEQCPECAVRLKNLTGDLDLIAGVRPYQPLLSVPNPKGRRALVYSIIRAVAFVAIGVFVGFSAARWFDRGPAEVSFAYITLTPPDDTRGGAFSDATGIPPSYYEEILRSQR